MSKVLALFALVASVVCPIWFAIHTVAKLEEFKTELIREQGEAVKRAVKAEASLLSAYHAISQDLSAHTQELNASFDRLSAELDGVRGVPAAGEGVDGKLHRSAAAPQRADGTGTVPTGTGLQVCQTALKAAKQRVLQEARAHDALAMRYNALLDIYKQAQEVINAKKKD